MNGDRWRISSCIDRLTPSPGRRYPWPASHLEKTHISVYAGSILEKYAWAYISGILMMDRTRNQWFKKTIKHTNNKTLSVMSDCGRQSHKLACECALRVANVHVSIRFFWEGNYSMSSVRVWLMSSWSKGTESCRRFWSRDSPVWEGYFDSGWHYSCFEHSEVSRQCQDTLLWTIAWKEKKG